MTATTSWYAAVRAATDGRRGQLCARNLCPAVRARSIHRLPQGQTRPEGPQHGFIAKVRVAGSSPVVRSKAQVKRHLHLVENGGRASPWKGEGRGLEPRR